MNKERKYYHTAFVEKYIVDGVNDYKPLSWNFFFGRAFRSHAPVIIGPSFYGNDVVEVTIMGSKNKLPSAIFKEVSTGCPLTYMFKGSKLIDRHACSLRTFDSLRVPYKVASELNGDNGFEQYTTWWQKSFEFNSDDYLKVAQGYALVPAYADDELDYLFSLAEDEVLQGTFSQYKTPKLMWASILKHKDKIAREKPHLYKKVCTIDKMSLSTTF